MKKEQLAEFLKSHGYFSKYSYISDILKDFSYSDLKMYYRECERNIKDGFIK